MERVELSGIMEFIKKVIHKTNMELWNLGTRKKKYLDFNY